MTDKQTIIDGVNVTECRYFISEWDFNNCGHICKGTECKYKRLWYKKQLKRKEQECKRLKFNNDYQVAVLETTIDNLKTELEQEQTLKEMYFTYYKAKHGDIEGKFFSYKQALTEIKEIAERCYDPVDKENDGFWSILQIISEAEL